MKKVTILALAIMLGAFMSLNAQSIVVNGDYESWTGGVPDSWTTIESGIIVTEETTIIHDGSKSASVDVITGSQGDTDFRQDVTVTGGTDYDISVWVYHTEGNVKARLYVGGYDNYSDNTIIGGWQEVTTTYSAGSDGTIELGLRFYDQTGFDGDEIVYVDDYTMTPQGGGSTTTYIYMEPFDTDLGQTTQYDVLGAEAWEWASFGNPAGCAKMSGYAGGNQDNEDWMITNSFDCTGYTNVTLSFYHARNYADNSGLSVLISTDYDGSSDPSGFTWTDLTSSFAFPSSGSWSFMDAGTVDINALVGPSTYVAYKYTSTTTAGATWEVDNIAVEGDGSGATAARIVGSMQGWDTTDPDYVMTMNANGLYELTKSLDAGDNEYKVLEGDDWTATAYPVDNQHVILTATEDVTWKANIDADLVTHTLPVVAGDFLTTLGGTNWEPTELMGEMSDPEGDDIFTLELTIPIAGDYQAKVTLNNNWNQSTGGNVTFTSDGVTPTTFTYDFPNNTTTISGPPPPTAMVTFMVKDTINMMYDGFFLKGSWDADGQYDPSWGGGIEHTQFYDDGTNGDVVAGDHIWTCQQDLVVDGGTNTWEWGVNDTESFWVTGNWQFTVATEDAQTLTWIVPEVPGIVINEIMYNSAGADEEWIELYNTTAASIDLENYRVCDNDQSHTNIVIPAGYSIAADGYFTISISTDGAFPFTPDYDGTGNFGLGNGGDAVRIWNSDNILTDIVDYDDGTPWPSAPDGDGPSLSLISPELDNSLAESWKASNQDGGTPNAFNFPIVVTAPNGGEVLETGTTFDITWTIDQYAGDINIELIREGENPQLIVSNLPSSNLTFEWNILDGTSPASDYKILISDVTDPAIFDESDSEFSITEGFVEYDIVITEIMYNPPESGTDSLEFLEIYNNGTETVNLDGFTFVDGVEFTFPNVDITPEEYVLVGINSDAMFNTFGVTAYQWTSGALSNGGEKIQLNDGGGNIVDSLTYSDDLPWDTLCDGYGPSLTLCNPDVDNSVAENWTHSLNLAAINAEGDSIFATPGSGCDVDILAGFEGEPTSVSLGGSVVFTDLSLGDITEWTWTFEGGEPATYSGQNPPEIFYNTEGTFDVTLLVSNGADTDELTYVDYIEVIDLPAPTNLVAVVGPEDDVQLSWNAPGPGGFADDFESYEDFVIEFNPWVCLDVDGSTTYGMTDITWTNAYEPQAFIIFNPTTTEPVVEDVVAHSGNKLAACFASTAAPNNDWMISPMVNVESGFNASFYAKSYTDQYGLERFKVGVSTTGMNPEDFTIISEGDYLEAPVEDWTEFIFSLEDYVGQDVYVGIQCVSNDAFIFLVDDFTIGASKSAFTFNTNTAVVGSADRNISYTAVANTIPVAQQIEAVRTDDPLGYNVYRDGSMINAALVEATQYNDAEPTIGSHDYYVTAVYDGGESGPSNVVSVIVTDINENETGNIRIYPNPANGLFNIELSENLDVEVSIIDLTGKVVYNNNLIESAQVNVSGFNSGIYFVRILDNTTGIISAHKLIIK